MSEISAKINGAAQQAATVFKGQRGIYAALAKEHAEIASLLREAQEDTDPEHRHRLLRTVRHVLLSHARAEERTLYRALADFDDTRSIVAHGHAEHDELERLLRNVTLFELGSEAATQAIADLRAAVGRHVEEEESDLFARAQDLLYVAESRRLEDLFRSEKETEKRRLELEVIL